MKRYKPLVLGFSVTLGFSVGTMGGKKGNSFVNISDAESFCQQFNQKLRPTSSLNNPIDRFISVNCFHSIP